jgi:hypothetical protein
VPFLLVSPEELQNLLVTVSVNPLIAESTDFASQQTDGQTHDLADELVIDHTETKAQNPLLDRSVLGRLTLCAAVHNEPNVDFRWSNTYRPSMTSTVRCWFFSVQRLPSAWSLSVFHSTSASVSRL